MDTRTFSLAGVEALTLARVCGPDNSLLGFPAIQDIYRSSSKRGYLEQTSLKSFRGGDMENNPLNCLPEEITFDIFSRLPVESVLDSMLVCKPWRHLLQIYSNTYFAYLHLRRQQEQHQTLDGDSGSPTSFVGLQQQDLPYYVKYNDEDDRIRITRRINLKFPVDVFRIVGSCNGLICLSVDTKKYQGIYIQDSRRHSTDSGVIIMPLDHTDEPFYICNPITREYVNLPELQIPETRSKAYIVYGFGYHPLTNEYKVIRFLYPTHQSQSYKLPITGHCEVYTLGSGRGWRSAGEINQHIDCFSDYAKSVCLDGTFYWLCEGSKDILAFNLADEKFYWLSPPNRKITWTDKLCVIRGCLGLVRTTSAGLCMELWIYKSVNERSSSYQTTCKSWCYSKGFSEAETKDFNRYCFSSDWAKRTPFINSFVSLKALGENNVKVFSGYPAFQTSGLPNANG